MIFASSRTTWRAESAVAVLRAEATDETQGFMKVLVGANDDRILGFAYPSQSNGSIFVISLMAGGLPTSKD